MKAVNNTWKGGDVPNTRVQQACAQGTNFIIKSWQQQRLQQTSDRKLMKWIYFMGTCQLLLSLVNMRYTEARAQKCSNVHMQR